MIVLNVIGAVICLAFTLLLTWNIPAERAMGIDSSADTGQGVVWALLVIPIYAVYLILNLAWGGFIVACRNERGARFCFLALMVWIVATLIDFARWR